VTAGRPADQRLDEVEHAYAPGPKAQQHGLARQGHLAFAFDPTTFTRAVLAFTTSHNL
jgi:hypothetical protein